MEGVEYNTSSANPKGKANIENNLTSSSKQPLIEDINSSMHVPNI